MCGGWDSEIYRGWGHGDRRGRSNLWGEELCRYPPSSSKEHHIRETVSIFVENFPTIGSRDWLHRVFERFGRISEVFIPNKLSRIGSRFAFVRLASHEEAWNAIDSMNGVWVDHLRLVVKTAKPISSDSNKQESQPVRASKVEPRTEEKEKAPVETQLCRERKSCRIETDNEKSNRLNKCFLGISRCFFEPSWLIDKLHQEEIFDIWISRISCDSFLIGSTSETLNNLSIEKYLYRLRQWFSSITPCPKDIPDQDRLASLIIYGLPFIFWKEENIKAIANLWGAFISVEGDPQNPIDSMKCRVTIKTNFVGRIDEEISIHNDSQSLIIRVVESENEVIWPEKEVESTVDCSSENSFTPTADGELDPGLDLEAYAADYGRNS